MAVTTDALKRSVALEVFMKAMLSAVTLATGTWTELPGAGMIQAPLDDEVESPSTALARPAWGDWAVAGAATARPTTTPGPPLATIRAE